MSSENSSSRQTTKSAWPQAQQRERHGDVVSQVLRVVLGGRDLEIFLREGGILEVLQARERAEQLVDGRLREPLRGLHRQRDRGDVPDQRCRVVQGQDQAIHVLRRRALRQSSGQPAVGHHRHQPVRVAPGGTPTQRNNLAARSRDPSRCSVPAIPRGPVPDRRHVTQLRRPFGRLCGSQSNAPLREGHPRPPSSSTGMIPSSEARPSSQIRPLSGPDCNYGGR